ncbi:MAG: hypothetical protein QOD00_1706 [Blastocatellia bacterium]|jgi:hypothetical protein|nr:hypothetical protein [Blastocatellia bacterium]
MLLETVKVQHPTVPGDYTIINTSDFNPDAHKLFVEAGAPPARGVPQEESTVVARRRAASRSKAAEGE